MGDSVAATTAQNNSQNQAIVDAAHRARQVSVSYFRVSACFSLKLWRRAPGECTGRKEWDR